MANPERGEVDLSTSEKTYTLVLSLNAICDMQQRTGKTYGELVRSMAAMDLVALRDIVWMTLRRHHAKEFPNPQAVGDLIDQLPHGVNDAVLALGSLFTLNASRGTNGNGAGDAVDPPPAQS